LEVTLDLKLAPIIFIYKKPAFYLRR